MRLVLFLTNGTGLVVWIPFQPSTPDTDGLKFIAGSHKFPASSVMPSFCNAELPGYCMEEIGKRQEEDPTKKVLTYDLKVGDAIFFDKSTMHASTGLNMSPRHSLQIRLFGAGDDVKSAYFKNVKGAAYGVPYGLHDDRANTFRFPQIYPNIQTNEFAKRIAYKTSSGLVDKVKYLFDMARVSIDSFRQNQEVDHFCSDRKCFRG
uniref:Phytanoyl-CoA dioxygenase n=1 Tax=Helicotheca tamesis TaxID=374047 RepID=A0A7S2GRY1_9STRA|mmetsp:Transcript_11492/g.15956  ORF Transcript_11492/g.15956 Transcript_11492/m.15956 type:complete len:205 (+) Transcript_11492:644-1258(+)